MSIGGNCRGMPLLGKNRIRGPIDNVELLQGLLSSKILFENTLLDILNKEIPEQHKRKPTFEGDSDISYIYSEFMVVHNNPLNDGYIREITKRMDTFNTFLSHIGEPNYFFIYTLNNEDFIKDDLGKSNFNKGLNFLIENNLLEKVIFIGTKCEKKGYDFLLKKVNSKIKYIQINDFHQRKTEKMHEEFMHLIENLV